MTELHRIALLLHYRGTNFYGFQRQAKQRSVQGTLETVLSKICGHEVVIHGAGRTDTGVHASGQVVHFDTTSRIPGENWPVVLANRLPPDLLVALGARVYPPWHSRFTATWREYIYTIYNHTLPDLVWQDRAWCYRKYELDCVPMAQALTSLLGDHDLAAFQLTGSDRAHSRVRVHEVACWREGHLVYIRVRALSFLYGMMRLLAGLLVPIGAGLLRVEEFIHIWQTQNRKQVYHLAPPQGLCLVGVGYPHSVFSLPEPPPQQGIIR